MRKHFLAVLAYVVTTFATQAVSHFGVNAAHYAAVTYLRAQPIFALGVLSMLIQGSIMSYLYAQLPQSGRSIGHAVLSAWTPTFASMGRERVAPALHPTQARPVEPELYNACRSAHSDPRTSRWSDVCPRTTTPLV